MHIEGPVKPQNLKQQSALRRWSDTTETTHIEKLAVKRITRYSVIA